MGLGIGIGLRASGLSASLSNKNDMPFRQEAKRRLPVGEIVWLLPMTSRYLSERMTIAIAPSCVRLTTDFA